MESRWRWKLARNVMTAGGRRAPLFKVHAHPIRVLVDYGYMPVKHRLTPQELAELKAWLEAKP